MADTPTEKPDNNRVRLTADYQLMSDEQPGHIWADIVLGGAKDKGSLITDYNVLQVATGAFGLQYVLFTVDLEFGDVIRSDMDHRQAREAGEVFLNALIGDSDVSVRWATGVEV